MIIKGASKEAETVMWVATESGHRILREFVAEVLTVCKYDYDGVTYGLEDKAFQAGAELGMTRDELEGLLNKNET